MTDTTAEAAQAAPEAPKAEFASMEGRTKVIPLRWPVRFGGKVYDQIEIRRITGAEMAHFVSGRAAGVKLPYPGVDVPMEVYESLDADDHSAFNEALADFLPLVLAEGSEPDQPKSAQ